MVEAPAVLASVAHGCCSVGKLSMPVQALSGSSAQMRLGHLSKGELNYCLKCCRVCLRVWSAGCALAVCWAMCEEGEVGPLVRALEGHDRQLAATLGA
jgi:hypothetical protein